MKAVICDNKPDHQPVGKVLPSTSFKLDRTVHYVLGLNKKNEYAYQYWSINLKACISAPG